MESTKRSDGLSNGSIRHFYELDSLRGVAALSVVFWHFSLAFPRPWLAHISVQFPMRIAFSGHQAVILFFVLSGFVLTLPALRGKQPAYPVFLMKRILRIYVPYLGALLLALCGDALFHSSTRTGTDWKAAWANQTWSAPISPTLLLHQLSFLGNYDWAQVNTAFWSLIFELRISLIFPLLILAVLTLRSRWVLLGAAVLTLAACPLATLASAYIYMDPKADMESHTFMTMHYAAIFLVGSVLAANLNRVASLYHRASRWAVAGAGLLTVILYDGRFTDKLLAKLPMLHALQGRLFFHEQPGDWSTAAGALLLIVLAMHLKPLRAFLHTRPLHHLGKVSYSLYLVHGTVLFSLMHLLPMETPIPFLLAAYLAATLLLTEAFYRLVEVPSMHAGKRVSMQPRTPTAALAIMKGAA